ncbi:patatin-like phospholipase family protein [Blastococcus xanthinilyticus]|uniref:patatin-like phospholipase family protein n=1 Tax=Blastococcus xanthinilyticus TaxID=1564164 RepID=UPI0014130352|nr:patatin-like phospholipase family protein [Blastococcus xanthinilyticus]
MAGRVEGRSRALVLGGGGIAGIAWEIGLLAGLAEHGVDVRAADLIVGTSAGSIVGTLLLRGGDLQELYAVQATPPGPEEPVVEFDALAMMTAFGEVLAGATAEQDARARIGGLALRSSSVPESERRAIIAGRVGDPDWPEGRLVVTAVDTGDGSFHAFDSTSGIPLLDAVAASCAVPTVWPPTTIGGRRFMDGGMRSMTNADLAAGAKKVLVVAPFPGTPGNPMGPDLAGETEVLRRDGEVHVLLADDAALEAFGTNPLAPASRQPAALAGRAQADAVWAEVAAFWS